MKITIVFIACALAMVHALTPKMDIFAKYFEDCQAKLPADAKEPEIIYCVLQKDKDVLNEDGMVTQKKAVAYCAYLISDPVKLIRCQTIVSRCFKQGNRYISYSSTPQPKISAIYL